MWGYVVGGRLVSGTTQQCTINTHCIIHDTVYATHSGSYAKRKYTTHVVHNGTQHSQWCIAHTGHRNIWAW